LDAAVIIARLLLALVFLSAGTAKLGEGKHEDAQGFEREPVDGEVRDGLDGGGLRSRLGVRGGGGPLAIEASLGVPRPLEPQAPFWS
jgi:hypothetical protein